MKRTSDRLLSRSQVLATIAGAIVLYLASWWPMRGPSDLCQAPAGRPWLVRWSASGMESSLATLLVLAGFAADLHRDPPGSSARAPAWCWALASLVRPEACLLLGLLALRSALGPGPLFARSREVAWTLLPVALLGGSWLAYAASTYGTIVPTTLASKAAEGTPALQNLLVQAQELAADRGVEIIALLAAVPLLAGRLRREWREHLVPVGWLVLLPLFYASSRVLGITRYVLLLVPVLVCYGWPAIVYLANRAGRGGGVALPRAVMLAAGLAALGANTFVLVHQVVPQARAFNARVAIAHVGAFGYYSERKIVDLGGLVTPALGPLLARYQYERLVSEFRFATVVRPDYVIDVDTESRRMLSHSPYAPCLELLEERPYDYRSIRHPEPAFLTATGSTGTASTPAHRDPDECSAPGACGARLQGSRARGRPAVSS